MQALLLAGGKGIRLRPFTYLMPKPMLPVGDMPLLEVIVRQLAEHGVDHIILALNYKAKLIQDYFGAGRRYGVDITYFREKEYLGTAGCIAHLEEELDDDFIVMNADILADLDFNAFFKHHVDARAHISMVVRSLDIDLEYGVVELSGSGDTITTVREKPTFSYYINTGIYGLNRSVANHIERGRPTQMTDLINLTVESGEQVVPYEFKGYWIDVGRCEDYEIVNREVQQLEFIKHIVGK